MNRLLRIILSALTLATCSPVPAFSAAKFRCGYEISKGNDSGGFGNNHPDGWTRVSGFAYWSDVLTGGATARSGRYYTSYHTGATNDVGTYFSRVIRDGLAIPSGTSAYITKWMYIKSSAELPLVNEYITAFETAPTGKDLEVYWTTADKIAIAREGIIAATSSSTTPRDQWFCIQVCAGNKTSGNKDTVKFNNEILTSSSNWSANPIDAVYNGMGQNDGATVNHGATYFDDDFAVNDASGTDQNTYPDTSEQIFDLWPVNEASIAGWTGGAGGSTDLWKAVDNVPPVGTSSTEQDTSNIKNTTSSATDSYVAILRSYLAASLPPAGKSVRIVQGYVRHGEHAASGTENGTIEMTSNPNAGGNTTFTFGGDAGAHGADFNSGLSTMKWITAFTPFVYDPSLTLANQPQLTLMRATANTNQICADRMGIIVSVARTYAPAVTSKGVLIQ